jgi:hypothetical protein
MGDASHPEPSAPRQRGSGRRRLVGEERLDWISLVCLAANLAETPRRLAPGERITLGRCLRRCLPFPFAREIRARLRAQELYLSVDGRPVTHTGILLGRESRVVVYVRQGGGVLIVEPDPEAGLN